MTVPGGTRTPPEHCNFLRARRTGYSHRVGVSSLYLAPVLRPDALTLTPTPAKVATWHTKIRHLAYVLLPSSVIQSDQSPSRVPSDSFPLPEQPGFSVAGYILGIHSRALTLRLALMHPSTRKAHSPMCVPKNSHLAYAIACLVIEKNAIRPIENVH